MPFISEVESIYIQRFYTGWITLRNQITAPIRAMGRRIIELYDALIAGNDWEITPKLSLKRRAGHTAYVTINNPAQFLYSWKSNTQGTIPIIDTTQDIEFINGTTVTALATKGTGTGQNLQSSISGIGNYLYVGNPQQSFKWDGPFGSQGVTNWGISIAPFGTSTLKTAGSGANGGGANVAWTNPGNVTGSSGFATVNLSANSGFAQSSQLLLCETFGYALSPAGTVLGVQLQMTSGIAWASGFGTTRSVSVQLLKNGLPVGTPKALTSGGTGTITLGGSSDTWGASFTGNDINQATFGVSISALLFAGGGGTSTFAPQFQNVRLTVTALTGPTATPTGSGSFSAINGYSYVIAYGNASSGEISNASIISANTGPFSSKQYVGVSVTASTDTQVNQIRVYRTTDSGGGNQFFEISGSPFANTTTTIQDTTPDTSLQVTSQAEINLGNTPPPAGLINLEWFAGRMWGSVNNVLFASTGPETLSGTAPNSNWNPLFQYVLPQPIIRNVRGPNGMLVFTVDDCYIVRGTDITNYTVNEFVKNFGIRTYNAIDTDGTNLYVFTSDRQFILVSASGAEDLGLPIGDQLLTIDPTQCYVSVNRYGLDAIVRILDVANNIAYDYNLNQQCWNLPTIFQMPSCSAMGSIETSPGVWQLLVSSTNAGVTQLAFRDIANFADLGATYFPNAVFGSIQLADPGNLAKFGALGGFVMEYANITGQNPVLTVLPNDVGCTLSNPVVTGGFGIGGFGLQSFGANNQITGNFVNLSVGNNPIPWPPTLGNQPINYRSLGYYYMMGKGLSAFVRHLQFQLSAFSENVPTELIGFGIFGDLKQETAQAGQIPQLQGR